VSAGSSYYLATMGWNVDIDPLMVLHSKPYLVKNKDLTE